MKLSKILESRTFEKRKIYCIETDEDLYVVKGQFIKKANTEIVKFYYDYINEKVEWRHLERKITIYFDKEDGNYINNKSYVEKEFKIKNVYTNDEKIF